MIRGLHSPHPQLAVPGTGGVKTSPCFGKGENRGHFHLLLRGLRAPQSPAATSEMSLLVGWHPCPVPPAVAVTGTAAAVLAPSLIPVNALRQCPSPPWGQWPCPGAAWQRAQAARQADVPRGCAVTFPALLVPHPESVPRTHNSGNPSLPTLPPVNNKGNQWKFKQNP